MSLRITIKVRAPELILESGYIRHQIVTKMQRKTAPDVQRLFRQTTRGWANPPNFLQKFNDRTGYVSVEVWPGQENKAGVIYALVNNGSPPHPIGPRRKKWLVFYRGYRAATRPRVLSSSSPSRYGQLVITSSTFIHPGFEAREFDATIAAEYADTFVRDMQDVIRVASMRSE